MSLRVELALREKRDGEGKNYLFAPLPLINMVCFVFEEAPRGGIRRAKLVLKPYDGNKEFRASWEEEDQAPARGEPRGEALGSPSSPVHRRTG